MNSSDAGCLSPDTLIQFAAHHSVDFGCKVMLCSIDTFHSMTLSAYLMIFGWTCLLESPFYLGYCTLRKINLKRALSLVFLANLATHPLVTFVFPLVAQALSLSVYSSTLAKELFAPLVEAWVCRKITRLHGFDCLAMAFLANLCSWWIGTLLSDSWF